MRDMRHGCPGVRWRVGLVAVLLVGLVPFAGTSRAAAASGAAPALSPNPASGQPVGTTVLWTATGGGTAALEYRFTVTLADRSPVVARDFAPGNTFSWTPLEEGDYQIAVVAREIASPTTTEARTTAAFRMVSRISAYRPVVSPTAHPLVALYSIPPCGTGTVQVVFGANGGHWGDLRTPQTECSPVTSTNVYLVGMRPTTSYAIQAVFADGATTRYGPVDTWTSGAIPEDVHFPASTTPVPPTADTSLGDGIVFRVTLGTLAATPQVQLYATDLQGNVVWYSTEQSYIARPLPGGDTLAHVYVSPTEQLLRISDPAGNPIRETSTTRINEQLATLLPPAGTTIEPIRALHHEANLLPNGHLVVFGYTERLFPPGTQGSTTGLPVDFVGDEIIDLDENLQVAWVWNAFDHLDVNRPAILGEDCEGAGCTVPLQYAAQAGGVAADWLHSNAITYSPADHNLLVSVRHQDWILKLDYRDGQGDGRILWRLGNGGDFALDNPPADDPFPWFSHQHGIELTTDGRLVTFDNGNTRCAGAGPDCHSRGQVYQLDEEDRRATLLVNADMGNYSGALGWAQVLQNGNYAFTSGYQHPDTGVVGEVEEFDPTGTRLVYALQSQPEAIYRAYRLATPYDGCCGPPAAAPARPLLSGFADVWPADAAATAIAQLAANGVIRGCDPAGDLFCPDAPVLRAQMAALIARALDYTDTPPNPFADRCDPVVPADCVDDELWGQVAELARRDIARGYTDAATCGGTDATPCYSPRDPTQQAQVLSFITRALVAQGCWQQQPTDPDLFGGVLNGTGHETDVTTFVYYTQAFGGVPDQPVGDDFPGWERPATRSWSARALWAALGGIRGAASVP